MTMITKNQAVCMFYCEEYTPENIKQLETKLEQVLDLVLCYNKDPTDPVLISRKKLFSNPFKYHEYHDQISEAATASEDTEPLLPSLSMAKEFLNEVFVNEDAMNSLYSRKIVTMSEIQAVISPFTTLFNEKSSLGFAFSRENHTIIGYCRKSLTSGDNETRARLLQKMVNKLIARSLVDRVYLSPCSSANQEIGNRDLESIFNISEIEGAVGTKQDMISYIGMVGNVSLVALDFAGLTTNVNDLEQLLLEMPNIKNIIIDELTQKHSVKILSRKQLLDDQEINLFDCRTNCVQRSL
ncbi:MAG: hypothetical protein EXX96DRAFT_533975 [Benjaminiella poitrasii]|nr:MAG: hypothetical protein EXX96DRAFT_533975 [Benjaminiella poitrasii]